MAKLREQRKKDKQKKFLKASLSCATCLILMTCTGIWGITQILENQTSESVSKNPVESQTFTGSDIESPKEVTTETMVDTAPSTEELPEEEPPEELQIIMVGDMLIHDRIIASGLKEDGSYNYDHLFVNVKDFIQAADIAIVNQETIMGGKEYGYKGYPSFNSPYEVGDAEVKAGFNVILHATNHTLDKGKNAVLNCMDFWETKHPEVSYVGMNRTQEQRDTIFIYEENGIKVAILNYTYSTNGNESPSDMPFIVNRFVEKEIVADIQKAEELADFTIVCPHWGKEYSLEINSFQKKWTKVFLENGVDLVIGAHPHVIEPIEWVTDEDGHQMLVYYSLGNFVNGTSSTKNCLAHRMVGGIADVTIGRDETGEVVILEHDVVPIVCHIGEGDAYTVYYLEDYTAEMAKENRILLQDSDFSLEACWDVVHQVWGAE